MATTFDEAKVTSRLQELARAIEADRNKALSEAMTIHKYVTPLLGALGWQVFDDTLVLEHPVKNSKVDIALLADGTPVAFVEAKRLRQNLSLTDDEAAQAMRYGYESGVNWCVLTNGERYEVYDAFAKVDHEKKLVVSFSVTEAAAHPEQELPKLRLLSREAVAGDELAQFARESFARERVRELLEDPPAGVLAALHVHLKACGMTEEDVRVGLGAVLGVPAQKTPYVPCDGNPEGERPGFGLRAFVPPVQLAGDSLRLTRVGSRTRRRHTVEVPVSDLRLVAGLLADAPDAGVNCADLWRASNGALNYDRTVNAMGALYALNLIESVKGRSVEMRLTQPLTPDQIIERVLSTAEQAQ